jgi:hypothetical protein
VGWRIVDVTNFESGGARRARYARMAIAAAVAAARARLPEVRTAYLLIAESWHNLAKREDEKAGLTAVEEKTVESSASEETADFRTDFED